MFMSGIVTLKFVLNTCCLCINLKICSIKTDFFIIEEDNRIFIFLRINFVSLKIVTQRPVYKSECSSSGSFLDSSLGFFCA